MKNSDGEYFQIRSHTQDRWWVMVGSGTESCSILVDLQDLAQIAKEAVMAQVVHLEGNMTR